MVTSVGHSLLMASHFVIQHCGSFTHLMLPYIRGAIFSSCCDAAFTHKLQLFKNKLHDCQHGVFNQMCILGSVDVLNILGLAKTHGPHNRTTSHASLLQQTIDWVVNVSTPTWTGKGQSNWPGVRRKTGERSRRTFKLTVGQVVLNSICWGRQWDVVKALDKARKFQLNISKCNRLHKTASRSLLKH